MKYELAKELKDAEWPQEINEGSFYFVPSGSTLAGRVIPRRFCWGGEGEDKPYGEYVLDPSLSELIEACGDGFVGLDRTDEGWQATGVIIPGDLNRVETLISHVGKSPEEAVAKLWLALNKK